MSVANTEETLKIPPHAHEAERFVLGGIMANQQAFEKIEDIIRSSDFYLSQHAKLFTIISSLAQQDKPYDANTLIEGLTQDGRIGEVGGEAYIYSCLESVPSTINIDAYAKMIFVSDTPVSLVIIIVS